MDKASLAQVLSKVSTPMFILRTFRRLLRGRQPQPPEDAGSISIVLLLRETRDFPESVVSQAAERAWNADFHTEGSGNCVIQEQRLCLVKFGGELFHVLNSAQPYGNAPERAAQTMKISMAVWCIRARSCLKRVR